MAEGSQYVPYVILQIATLTTNTAVVLLLYYYCFLDQHWVILDRKNFEMLTLIIKIVYLKMNVCSAALKFCSSNGAEVT